MAISSPAIGKIIQLICQFPYTMPVIKKMTTASGQITAAKAPITLSSFSFSKE
ncbi:hypothetical protein AAHB53_18440 [Niallia circulans]